MTTLDRYAAAQTAAGRSPHTIRLRLYWLTRFPGDLDTATTADLQAFMTGGYSKNTLRSIYAAFRSYYRWSRPDHDPSDALEAPPQRKGTPHPCSERLYAEALAAATGTTRTMLLLAGRAGLRRGEIAAVRREDVSDLGLTIHGKGDRLRLVRLGAEVRADLETYGPGWLFPARFGDGHMHVDAVGKAIRRAFGGAASAHDARHRFASVTFDRTRNLLAVQQSLGHADPSTTQGYIQIGADALQAVADAA